MKTFLKFIGSVFSIRGWLIEFYAGPALPLNYYCTSPDNASLSVNVTHHHDRQLAYYIVNRQWHTVNGKLQHERQFEHYPLEGALYA